MLDQLSGRSLVSVKEKTGQQLLSMHRVVQEKTKSGFEPSRHQESFERALTLVRKKYPSASVVQVPDLVDRDDHRKYTPHVLSLYRAFKATSIIRPSIELAELLYDAGFAVWACQTAISDGIELLGAAEAILNTLGEDPHSKLRAHICSTLGNLLELTGATNREESFRRREEARMIREKIVRDDPGHKVNNILLQNAANDYAMGLLDKN